MGGARPRSLDEVDAEALVDMAAGMGFRNAAALRTAMELLRAAQAKAGLGGEEGVADAARQLAVAVTGGEGGQLATLLTDVGGVRTAVMGAFEQLGGREAAAAAAEHLVAGHGGVPGMVRLAAAATGAPDPTRAIEALTAAVGTARASGEGPQELVARARTELIRLCPFVPEQLQSPLAQLLAAQDSEA